MTKIATPRRLTPKQAKLVEFVADFTDKRSVKDKALAAGYESRQAGYQALRIPHVIAALEDITTADRRSIVAHRNKIMHKLAQQAADGDVESQKLFFQIIGEIGSGGNVQSVKVTQTAPSPEVSYADRLQDAYKAVNRIENKDG